MSFVLRWSLCLALAVGSVAAGGAAQGRSSRALWVWDSAPLLQDASARFRFFEFCRARGIDIAWLQVTPRQPGGARLQQDDRWRSVLHDAHVSGVSIHALDGDPSYALRDRHDIVLALVDAIIRFNREAPRDQRFDGIHLDIEPYLLDGWRLPSTRERLLASYLELNARIERTVHAEGGLEYGVDIPFWWQMPDGESGGAIGDVMFEGVRKPASFHILDLVDNVGIMDYRNVAGGDDGLIAHARALLEYSRNTKSRVFVGVETSPAGSAAEQKLTFHGRSNAEMEHELALAHAAFAGYRSYAGFAIHHYGAYRHRFADGVGIESTE